MNQISEKDEQMCAELEAVDKKHKRIGSYITKAASYGALASLLLSLGQCTRSCVSYDPGKGSGELRFTADRLKLNDMNLQGAENGFRYGLDGENQFENSSFISERPDLLEAVRKAQQKTIEARTASEEVYDLFQKTPEYKQWITAEEKSSAQFVTGIGLFGGFLASGLLAMIGHRMNEHIENRKRTGIYRTYGKE